MKVYILTNKKYHEKFNTPSYTENDYWNYLIIEDIILKKDTNCFCENPGKNIRAYIDNPDKENNNNFFNDLSWIKDEIKAAYSQGYNDGYVDKSKLLNKY